MAIKYEPIENIPETAGRRGPRDSECMRAYQATKNAATKQVEVQADDREEAERFYKSMIQWRNRHRDSGIQVRKDGSAIYLWIDEKVAEANKK